FLPGPPIDFEFLDRTLAGVALIGQHAMAGTLHGFLDHTQRSKQICRFLIDGEEHGELSQFALYAGAFGVPLRYASGDEALCAEARRLFPWVVTTPTKRGTGWESCELYAPETVRANIRRDIARAFAGGAGAERTAEVPARPWTPTMPIEVTVECAWSGLADAYAKIPGVRRRDARSVCWKVHDPRYIYSWPSEAWHPRL
ncbi:MAG: M55 family metallopeptidase, partial [Opitutaceae bacterium]